MALQSSDAGPSMSPFSKNSPVCFEYDAFLSFRGEDTCNNFAGLLHEMIDLLGIHALFDEVDLEKGEKVEEILGAVNKSRILVPIFSKRYAESKWCLREVAKMVESCHEYDGGQERRIIPVFFDVDPKDVRHQTGPFEAAFQKYQKEKKEEVDGWKDALRYVGEIPGLHLKNGDQRELIKLIAAAIKKVLPIKRLLSEGTYTVGLEHRVEEMMKRLDFQANDVRIVGIHGIGGIGKTTLAKAVYNRSHRLFEACSFIENVREVSKLPEGLVQLQKQLIQDVSKGKHTKEINNSIEGTEMIIQLVGCKSVLLVLDDVDEQEQLDGLARSLRWFHSGSTIIITTRKEEILKFAGLPDEAVYMLEELNEKESLQLFNYHAFGGDKSQEQFFKLSNEIVSISNGLPLVLEAFGSLFKTAKTPEEWNKLLEDLRLHQNSKVHEKLRICYDSLDEREKLIFLDIACLLVGKNLEDAIYMWEDHHSLPPASEVIRSLQNRSLIKINNGKFEMHDQIRDMGREIVLRESLLHPSCRSRLWRKEDVEKASTMSQGNEIQGILLNLREGSEMELSTQGFGLMAQLRVLLINVSISYDCDFMHFPASLKWLEWKWCPLGELPLESKFKGIVVLNLSHSFISQLWKETTESSSMPTKEVFESLKVLDLSCCECLNATSNFAMAPNLEKLILDECSNLKEVDDSIAALKKLVFLSMKGCASLEKLPSKIYELSSLKVFNLEGCSNLVAFPQFPPTISTNGLFNLQELILRGCECLEFVPKLHEFRSLRSLDMDGCRSLDHTRDLLFEDDVAVREWDELSMSESQTPLYWKEEFSFMLPCGSVNDPLLLKQLLCHNHDDPINSGTMILRVRYEDTANGNWVETILEGHCNDSFGSDDIYGYTVQLPWDDKVNEASRHTSMKMKVKTASNHVLTKVDVKLQKRSKFSGENLKPFIMVSRKSTIARPEFSIFINFHEEYKPDVIEYSRELDDHIDELRRLDVRIREQRPLFGWMIEELVILSLIFCDVKVSWYEQWPETALQASEKVFEKMKVLNLSQCKFLVKTPDFARTPHLKTLILDDCECLVEIGESIGQLKKLIRLSIVGCTKLRTLPFAILQLNSLPVLNLSNCCGFVNILPEASLTDASSDAFRELILDDCISLQKLPECVGRVKSLQRLSLRGCRSLKQLPDSIECLVALEVLILDDCISLERLPDCVGRLQSLRRLYMRGCCSLEQLPDSVGSLETLEKLMLDHCSHLARLPASIGKLKRLIKMQATRCPLLKSLPDLVNLTELEELNVGGCTNLISIPGLQNLRSLKVLNMNECWHLDIDSVCFQLEEAVCPHLEAFSISKRCYNGVGTIQISFPPLHLRQVVLYGRIGWADVVEIKVGEESVGYLEESEVTFWEGDEINKRLRVLATATGDDASPRFRTLTICSPPGTHLQQGASIWFCHSLTSEPSKSEECQCQQQYDDDFCWSTSKRGCRSVKKLPGYVGCLETLEKLMLDDCISLERLPDYVGRLQSLRRLYMRGCRSVKQLPDSVGSLETLEELILDDCVSLERLPDCVGRLQSLRRLWMSDCRSVKRLPDSVGSLETLEDLTLDNCDSLEKLPDCVGRLPRFRRLYIRGCPSLTQLPDSVGRLEALEELMLDDCPLLARLPDSIGNLKRLTKMQVMGCPLLESMPDLVNLTALEELNLERCRNLIRIPGLQNLRSLEVLNMKKCWCLDIDSVCLQLEGAAFPHLKEFGISKQVDDEVDTMQIPFPPLNLIQVVLYGPIRWADVVEIKVGEESVGYLKGPEITFREDDEINKRLRVLATATRDAASPPFRMLTICSPLGTRILGGASIWFHQSLMSGSLSPAAARESPVSHMNHPNQKTANIKRMMMCEYR